jgi:hypothetical protein
MSLEQEIWSGVKVAIAKMTYFKKYRVASRSVNYLRPVWVTAVLFHAAQSMFRTVHLERGAQLKVPDGSVYCRQC